MALTPAYAVDGGRVPAQMLRMMAWAATGGGNGIVRPGDLKVTALATPGGSVNIGAGGALAVTRYSGASGAQTYAAYNDATAALAIPATGSGAGRTDYIILRVDDWHFDGSQAPADPLAALYCSFQRVSALPTTYPYVPLAKITIPASTGTITNAMITDLRVMARPRRQRVLLATPTIASGTETLSSTSREYFPNQGGQKLVDIPDWATRVAIRADWIQVVMAAGNVQGAVWVGFGDWDGTKFEVETQTFGFDNVQAANASRATVTAADELVIPAKYRGRSNVTFQMWARRNGTGNVGLKIDQWSGACLDLEFKEVAD